MVILGKPGNGELNLIQFVIAVIDSIISSLSLFMIYYTQEIEDKLFHNLDHLDIDKINTSVKYMAYVFKQMSVTDYIGLIIMAIAFLLITLRVTVWAGEDDRIII